MQRMQFIKIEGNITFLKIFIDVLQCTYVQKIIKKQTETDESPLYYVALENVFDIVKRAHIATGHGGRDKMVSELSKKYANITRHAIGLFKSLCVECVRKK